MSSRLLCFWRLSPRQILYSGSVVCLLQGKKTRSFAPRTAAQTIFANLRTSVNSRYKQLNTRSPLKGPRKRKNGGCQRQPLVYSIFNITEHQWAIKQNKAKQFAHTRSCPNLPPAAGFPPDPPSKHKQSIAQLAPCRTRSELWCQDTNCGSPS